MRRLQNEVKAIRHEAEREDLDRLARLCRRQEIYERLIVLLLMKDLRTAVAAVDDMVSISGRLRARDSRHAGAFRSA